MRYLAEVVLYCVESPAVRMILKLVLTAIAFIPPSYAHLHIATSCIAPSYGNVGIPQIVLECSPGVASLSFKLVQQCRYL